MINLNKKGQTIYQEMGLMLVSIILIGFSMTFLYIETASAKDTIYEMGPELSDPFPASFIFVFLNEKISNEDKTRLSLNDDSVYFVKDLFVLDTDLSKEIIEEYKEAYLEEQNEVVGDKTSLEYYQSFSGINVEKERLLDINYDRNNVPDIEDAINTDNYFFYIPTLNDKFTIIYFKTEEIYYTGVDVE